MNRRWICNDVWMDILPYFDRPQLGLKLALLSPRFDVLVDKHFDSGKSELTIGRTITIRKDSATTAAQEEFVYVGDNSVPFPLPDRPLPSKIRIDCIAIEYIDHSVIAFLRSNHQIFDKGCTDLRMWIQPTHNNQPIWHVFCREIWPIFSTNIRHLGFTDGDVHLDNLRRHISPTILTDLNQLNSIDSGDLLPIAIGDFDGPNATAGQVLYKWLHTPGKDGQPKRLRCEDFNEQTDFDWVNNFKEKFILANISSVGYKIHFSINATTMQLVPFELVNEWTKEKLTLIKDDENNDYNWIMKRCKIGETAAVQQQKNKNWDDSNKVFIELHDGPNCIGPLSPPSAEEGAGQSITNGRLLTMSGGLSKNSDQQPK